MQLDGPLARRHAVRLVGRGDDLVVFSHGFGTGQSAWRGIADALPERFCGFLYDIPGAGPRLPRDFDLDDYQSLRRFADDLIALLEEVGVRRCTFVGHSVSGMIGVLAAIDRPDLFERLILLNASPRYLDDAADGYAGGFTIADIEGLLAAMESNYRSWVAGFAPLAIGARVPAAVEEFSQDLLEMRPDVAARVARIIFTSDYRALLPEVHTPVCLIHSRSDIAVPEPVAHYLHAHLPDSNLEWIDAQGHLPHISAPGAFLRALLACLGD